MRLSIVIPVFNNAAFTNKALQDLQALPEDHEIIVVDNASTDETGEVLSKYPRVKVISNSENLGFAKACNLGYQASTADNVLFLNNDIRVKSQAETWTEALLKHCAGGLVGPTGGVLTRQGNFIKETDKIEGEVFYMSGWCLASSKQIWDQLVLPEYVGPFSEEFGPAYFEDTDLGLRAIQQGLKMKLVPVPVHHFGKMTSKKVGISKLFLPAKVIFLNKWADDLLSHSFLPETF